MRAVIAQKQAANIIVFLLEFEGSVHVSECYVLAEKTSEHSWAECTWPCT